MAKKQFSELQDGMDPKRLARAKAQAKEMLMMANRGSAEDKSRLSWWFPRLPEDILVPRTAMIWATDEDLCMAMDNEWVASFQLLCNQIIGKGYEFGWPIFLRTDFLSGKHSWKDTCFVENATHVNQHVRNLITESACADFMGFPFDCWIVRKLIPTTPAFHAFGGDMPIVKERRYFVDGASVLCHHPYWPYEAFDHRSFCVEGWRGLLEAMNEEGDAEVELLSKLSSKVGAALGGQWSIDWLWSEKEGQWYLTDMAEAQMSYHWRGCEKEKD